MSNVVSMPPPKNGNQGPAERPERRFLVRFVINVPGQAQQQSSATATLSKAPFSDDDLQALGRALLANAQTQARDAKSGAMIVGASIPMSIVILGFQELRPE